MIGTVCCPTCGGDLQVIPVVVHDVVSQRIRFALICNGCSLVSEVDFTQQPSQLIDIGGFSLSEFVNGDVIVPLTQALTAFANDRRES